MTLMILSAGAISVTAGGASKTSILISWTVIDGVEPSGYTISYMNTDNTECFTDSDTVMDVDASADDYDIQGLREGTEYTITVTLSHGGEATGEDTVVRTTPDAGNTPSYNHKIASV